MATIVPVPVSGYRGRLAPSPTGYLHVGHARTFWTAWQRARDAGGALVMRMEDLDPDRSRASYAEAALEDLRWLGIRWHEGPDRGGPLRPYVQSKRRPVYLEAWRKLLNGGFLFPCKCSRKDLDAALGAPHESARAPRRRPGSSNWKRSTTSPCTPAPAATNRGWRRNSRVPPAWIRNGPKGSIGASACPTARWLNSKTRISGPQRFVAGVDFGDFVVWRRDGVPSYQLACVADDAAMGITEVVRGADLLKSTARQILLFRALGVTPPRWFHCRLVVDHNGRRLAKRHDALSLRALRQRGLTPMNILSAELPMTRELARDQMKRRCK